MNENDKREDEQIVTSETPEVTNRQLLGTPADSAPNADNPEVFPPALPESAMSAIESVASVDPSAAGSDIGHPMLPDEQSISRQFAGNESDVLEVSSSVETPAIVAETGGGGSLNQGGALDSESSFGEGQDELGNLQFESPAPAPSHIGQDEDTGPDEVSYFGGMIKYVTEDRTSDLNPRTKRMLQPTADGGRPLARPVVEVRMTDEQLQRLHSQERLEAARKNEQTCRELVEAEIRKEFWRRDCQDRAIWGR